MWSQIYDHLDSDHDRAISVGEFKALGLSGNRQRKLWKKLDQNGDGIISRPEFRHHFEQIDPQLGNQLLTMMAAALDMDLAHIEDAEDGDVEEEEMEEGKVLPPKEPRVVRNVRKWMHVDGEGRLLNAALLDAAIERCREQFPQHAVLTPAQQSSLQAMTAEMQNKLTRDLSRVSQEPRSHSVAFDESVMIRYHEPSGAALEHQLLVEANVPEREARTALAGVRRMEKHMAHLDEMTSSKRKRITSKQLRAAWTLVMQDVSIVREKYGARESLTRASEMG